ncbi:ABC transporter ATP-binding protein [Crenobacter cavernae]|uniref:Spermidine/putrescine import ATP-binding protein PotA n=1 Tax=Crenobacter cavernae TaxID=2290923 RepID=A0A345Y5N5_9NEIS|nr:polyamine ABC transporter ATP-binding protein [Crenobacter cavernae]AXK39237.1 polyamine ABC transporter ATP-binding protein [Crenobacter cavernae]
MVESSVNQAAKTAASKPYLQIVDVVKKFGDNTVVDHINLSIAKNDIFALLGSSGCGKSTLLRMLAGMETPTSGKIILDGEDITHLAPYERPINMMFQSYALFPHMSVAQNIAFGLKQDGLPRAEIAERVERMLDLVQMKKYANRKPFQLSGGQQQRVALARSLAKRPKLLLLDEPLGALDKKLRQQTQLELVNLIEQVGVTCIMVTHDQEEAMTMACRIGIMSEGQLLQVASPGEIYERPNCRFTAEFIGETNLFGGHVVEDEPDYVRVQSSELPRPVHIGHGITGTLGMPVWLSVRPERVGVSRQQPAGNGNWANGTVHDIAYLGGFSIFHVRLDTGKVVKASVPATRWREESAPTWDEPVFVSWADNDAVVLTQ